MFAPSARGTMSRRLQRAPALLLSPLPPHRVVASSTPCLAGHASRRCISSNLHASRSPRPVEPAASSSLIPGYLDPVPPPPPVLTSLARWTVASSILALGTLLELPLLVAWRVLHTVSAWRTQAAPSLLRRVKHRLLSLSYHCRIRYCHHALRALHVTVRVVNRNPQPFALHRRPHLFVQCNQHSLLEPLCFHAASYLEYSAVRARGEVCCALCLLSTPHFFINVEYGLWPLLGWVQGGTAVWVVRQYKQQARNALDRCIQRMNPRAQLVATKHPSADASSSSLALPALQPDSFYISPEGGRSSDASRLQPYRTGAAVAAISAAAVVVPVIMRGVRQCMPKGEWRVRAGVCEVLYDEAIDTTGLSLEDKQRLTAEIRGRYERLLQRPEAVLCKQ